MVGSIPGTPVMLEVVINPIVIASNVTGMDASMPHLRLPSMSPAT